MDGCDHDLVTVEEVYVESHSSLQSESSVTDNEEEKCSLESELEIDEHALSQKTEDGPKLPESDISTAPFE